MKTKTFRIPPKKTSKKPKESVVEDYLTKRCKQLGIFLLKNTGMNGIPDRLLIKNGLFVFLELKRPGETPSELQREIMKKLTRHGAISHVADSKAQIDDILSLYYDPADMSPKQKNRLTKLYRLLIRKLQKAIAKILKY